MNNSDQDDKILLKLLNGELSEEEVRQLNTDEEFRKYQAILGEVDSWALPEIDIEKSYERLKKKKTPTKVISWYQTNVFKLAAAILVLAAAAVFFFSADSMVVYETAVAQTEKITLPDQSVVILGPSSKLSYDEDKWASSRTISLKGSAHFDVKKGSPFVVSFGIASVQVLGTSFEIKTFNNYASVMCYDGEIAVKIGDDTASLSKGQGLKINEQKVFETFEFANTLWSDDVVRFQSMPLSTVFESLSQRFDLNIDTSKIDAERTFTGSYTTQNVDLALKMVCEPMNISYERNGDSVNLQ